MPVADHERRDLVYWRAAEIGQQFFCNKVLLIFPGGGAQPGFTICHIQLYQGSERHVTRCSRFCKKFAFPLLGFPFGYEARFFLLHPFTGPVGVPELAVPLAGFGIFSH